MNESRDGQIQSTTNKKSWRFDLFACTLIVILSLALYFKTIDYDLVYDDLHIITYNKSITCLPDDPAGFARLFVQGFWEGASDTPEVGTLYQPEAQSLYRPVMLTVLGGLYYLFQDDTTYFHLLNIILNALVCLLVYLTVKRLFGTTRLAFFCGILYACHPIHTEAVSYVTGMGEVLGMLFFVLALYFYVKSSYGNGFKPLSYILSLLFFLIGLFTKEHVFTLIGVIVLYDLIQALQQNRPLSLFSRFGLYAGFIAMIACNLAARYNALETLEPPTVHPIDNVVAAAGSYGVQFLTALKVLSKGIWLTIFPIKLSPDYSFAAIRLSEGFDAQVIASILFVLFLLIVGFISLKKRSVLGFSIFWHFITIFVVSNLIIVVGTILGERLLYMPSLGVCLACAYLLDRLFAMGAGKRGRFGAGAYIASILFIGIAAAGSLKTLKECEKWESMESLFQEAVKVVPESSRAHFQLAQTYARNKIYQEAINEYHKVIQIDPSFVYAYLHLGDVYVLQGQDDKALMAYEHMQKLFISSFGKKIGPQLSNRLAALYTKMQNGDKAIAELLKVKELSNDRTINMRIGSLYMMKGDYEEAIAYYKEAYELEPDNLEAAYQLLGCYGAARRYDEEKAFLDRLEKRDTETNRALLYRANIHIREFETEKALETLDRAIARSENDPAAYAIKAQVLFSEFRLEEALKALEKTVELSPPQGQIEPLLQILQIHMELDDMEQAEATAERLLALPLTPVVKGALGDLYLQLNRPEEAVKHLRESIAGGIKSIPNYVNLGRALTALNKNEDIVDLVGPAVDELQLKDRELYQIVGVALIAVREYQRGVDLLKETLNIWGPNPWFKYQIAVGLVGMKSYDEAMEHLDTLVKRIKIPELLPLVYHLQARILLEDEKRRNPREALALAQKALAGSAPDAHPNSTGSPPEFYCTMARALDALGNREGALEAVQKGLESFPEHDDLRALNEELQPE